MTGASLFGVSSGSIVGTPSSLPYRWQLINGYLIGHSANLSGAILTGANLTNAYLYYANLTNADLTNTDLTGAELFGVISGSIVGTPSSLPSGWQLINGYLIGPLANLQYADLSNANLRYVNLTDANLTNANLTNADLTGANLPALSPAQRVHHPSLPSGLAIH